MVGWNPQKLVDPLIFFQKYTNEKLERDNIDGVRTHLVKQKHTNGRNSKRSVHSRKDTGWGPTSPTNPDKSRSGKRKINRGKPSERGADPREQIHKFMFPDEP